MKASKLFLIAAFASVFASAVAFASETNAAPSPTKIVHPSGLPRAYENAVVELSFTIDEAGVPRDIAVVDAAAAKDLSASLVPVISQWRFSPGYANGHAVTTHVVLPLKLIDEAKFEFSSATKSVDAAKRGV
jgi:TonB family protein